MFPCALRSYSHTAPRKQKHQVVHGETEHSRWVEHNESYQNHGPIAHASDRRATGRKGIQKSTEKARAATRAKVQKKPSGKAAGEDAAKLLKQSGQARRRDQEALAEVVDCDAEAVDETPTIAVTLYGRGKNNEIARLSVEQGVTARRLREIAARLLGQAPESSGKLRRKAPESSEASLEGFKLRGLPSKTRLNLPLDA